MLMVGGTATLEARFTVDGELADPAAVTGRVRLPDGGVDDFTPTSDSTGIWRYALALEQYGEYAWEIVGTGGDAAGIFGDTFDVVPSIVDGPPSLSHYVSTGDVETALGRALTDAEAARAEQLIPQVLALLERVLNRTLVTRTFTDERHVINQDHVLYPFHGPVAEVTGMRFHEPDATEITDYNVTWLEQRFTEGTVIYVSYVAGPTSLDPQVQGIVADAVAGAILGGAAASTGAIKSYSVEGTSITYGEAVSGGGAAGRVSVADLGGMKALRRVVWR